MRSLDSIGRARNMASLQNLTNQQIDEVLYAAAERQVPAAISVREPAGWVNYHTRLLAIRQGHVLLEAPSPVAGGQPREFRPADKVGVNFKLKHHKFVFTGTVAETSREKLEDGTVRGIVHVCSPTRMQRMQRRAFNRSNVPDNRIVRASFWLGGREHEPAGTTPNQPVWSGRVVNISAGGFQLTTENGLGDAINPGDTVGVRISFGIGEEVVYADAQFRHCLEEGGKFHLGFQFVGLGLTPEGRQTLQVIGSKANQFQRELSNSQATTHSRN
jgi:c-di-GMP-binding flagellar brake protein YcgR